MGGCVTVLPLLVLLAFVEVRAKVIGTYWGQNSNEGSLREACETGLYGIINIAFLTKFGSGTIPCVNLTDHCQDSCSVSCKNHADDIKFCQSKGIKVFLSLGGAAGSYGLSSTEDAKQVAEYLWENLLAGQSGGSGILGDVQLDGIDFFIKEGTNLYWDDLVRYLSEYNKDEKKVYLSAAPDCWHPDKRMEKAIDTWLFDYIWPQFYNNPSCQYNNGDASAFYNPWNEWTKWVKADEGSFLLGLPASPAAATSGGYVPPQNLNDDILDVIVRGNGKYGGVMLWSRYYDRLTNYSGQIINLLLFTPNYDQDQGTKKSSATLEYFSLI